MSLKKRSGERAEGKGPHEGREEVKDIDSGAGLHSNP